MSSTSRGTGRSVSRITGIRTRPVLAAVGGRIRRHMAARLSRLLVALALTIGAVVPSPAAASVVRLPTSQQSAASVVPARGAGPANARSYFGARYYRAGIGRFTTIDPELNVNAALLDPQRWNRYAYVRNNPLRFTDPDGRDIRDFISGALNALGSNMSWGLVPRQATGDLSYQAGQILGDVAALALAAGEGTAGLGAVATGGGLTVLSPAAGPAMVVVAPTGAGVAVVGGAAVVHSVGVGAVATQQLMGRVGDFTRADKAAMDAANARANGGVNKCTNCGQEVVKVGNEKGKTPPGNQLQRHHEPELHKGGNSKSWWNRILCRDCHVDIGRRPDSQ
jgi:RHS repeat-associated protein